MHLFCNDYDNTNINDNDNLSNIYYHSSTILMTQNMLNITTYGDNTNSRIYKRKQQQNWGKYTVNRFTSATSSRSQSRLARIMTKKLIFYQRNSNRKLLKLNERINSLVSHLTVYWNQLKTSNDYINSYQSIQWDIHVLTHDDSVEPCALYHIMQNSDVLVTSHGFQEIGKYFVDYILFNLYIYKLINL